MNTLKIKNFGPIREGYRENDGHIPFSKVMVLCGPQAVGKSCVAKLFSTFSWIEKALVRGDFDVKFLTSYNRFVKTYCSYQNIQNYFRPDTYLHYHGGAYDMTYSDGHLSAVAQKGNGYERPQVMYIPAERNILSVLENAENVKRLPASLNTLMDVFTAACRNMKGNVVLPVDHLQFKYDKLNKVAWVEGEGYSVRLTEASSGVQSLTPLFTVLDYLSRSIGVDDSSKSQKEREDIKKRIEELLKDDTLDAETRKALVSQVADSSNKRLLSIVEEPEQNLYPSSQRHILNSLLAINASEGNQLVMTTHSPYIINYLSLAVKAGELLGRLPAEKVSSLDKIVPTASAVCGDDVSVYELREDGSIEALEKYDGMPSDSNQLNMHLSDANELFNQLLDIEESL